MPVPNPDSAVIGAEARRLAGLEAPPMPGPIDRPDDGGQSLLEAPSRLIPVKVNTC